MTHKEVKSPSFPLQLISRISFLFVFLLLVFSSYSYAEYLKLKEPGSIKLRKIGGTKAVFDKGHKSRKQVDTKIDELHRQIGQLKVENDFLSRKLGF